MRKTLLALPTIAALALLAVAARGQTPSLADTAMTTGNNYDAETTAVVVPPGVNDSCPNGRIVVASGSKFRLLKRDLGGGTTQISPVPSPGAGNALTSFDNQMVRLPNGQILLLWAGSAGSPLPSPTPAWSTATGGKRGAYFIWRSSTCGDSWSQPSIIDSAEVTINGDKGKCAWPQNLGAADPHHIGGWDRPELYADPWNGKVYVTTQCHAGSDKTVEGFQSHQFFGGLLFVSHDQGVNWGDQPSMLLPNDYVPMVMTSTPSGRLFLFHCYDRNTGNASFAGDGEPMLYWSDDQGKSIAGKTTLYWQGDGTKAENTCQSIDSSFIPGGQRPGGSVALARVGTHTITPTLGADSVYVTYPAVMGAGGLAREVIRVVRVNVPFKPNNIGPIKQWLATVTASSGLLNASAIQGTLIEPDRLELPKESKANTVLLYWIESEPKAASVPTSVGKLFARYALIRDAMVTTVEPKDLSTDAAGARRMWVPNNGGFAGDYMKGAFFLAGGKLNFLAQWPETDPSFTNKNLNVHYKIITVSQ